MPASGHLRKFDNGGASSALTSTADNAARPKSPNFSREPPFLLRGPSYMSESQARAGISTGTWHGEAIYEGATHRGDAAIGASCHFDVRGDGRADGADHCGRGETGATRGNHRGDGAARGWRADHGDRGDQEPT